MFEEAPHGVGFSSGLPGIASLYLQLSPKILSRGDVNCKIVMPEVKTGSQKPAKAKAVITIGAYRITNTILGFLIIKRALF